MINHTNYMKYAVREIAPKTDADLLSEVIGQGVYELKPVRNKEASPVMTILAPLVPSPGLLETPTPPRKVPIKKEKECGKGG